MINKSNIFSIIVSLALLMPSAASAQASFSERAAQTFSTQKAKLIRQLKAEMALIKAGTKAGAKLARIKKRSF